MGKTASMPYQDLYQEIVLVFERNIAAETKNWFDGQVRSIINERSARKLYITHSLCSTKVSKDPIALDGMPNGKLRTYLETHATTYAELSRLLLLIQVLHADSSFFKDKVSKLIEVADNDELATFLKYLVFLPQPEDYHFVAVEALRTNVATIFDAIALDNPYPAAHFDEQQWNQMYLKAAFMQRDLGNILGVEERANANLTRIISDYAHERWAAHRTIDPEIWRPTSPYIDSVLLKDMERLFQSGLLAENRAAALVCERSGHEGASILLDAHPELKHAMETAQFSWENFKN